MTAEEMTAFDEFCIEKLMPTLDAILAAAHESMNTDFAPASEEISAEEAAKPMTDLLTSIEAEKTGYTVEDIENAISNIRICRAGGEKFSDQLLAQMRKVTKARIFNCYGPTEITVASNNK
jgi:hypothetical protein